MVSGSQKPSVAILLTIFIQGTHFTKSDFYWGPELLYIVLFIKHIVISNCSHPGHCLHPPLGPLLKTLFEEVSWFLSPDKKKKWTARLCLITRHRFYRQFKKVSRHRLGWILFFAITMQIFTYFRIVFSIWCVWSFCPTARVGRISSVLIKL